jgi:hypothetical protein
MSDIADIIKDIRPIHYWVTAGVGFIIGTNYAEYESVIKWSEEHHNTSLRYYRQIRKEKTEKSISSKTLYYLGTGGREYAILQLHRHGRK